MLFEIRCASSFFGFGEVIEKYPILQKYNYKQTKNKETVEINNLEKLMELIKDVKNDLVISKDEILIYDDYLE